jgi:signal peptidase I
MEKQKIAPKSFWRKLWWFLWEDNSVWSWIANILIAFVLIKFVIYPGLGFLLGTGFPIVAVVSSSMEHDGSFEQWYASGQGSDAFCKGKAPEQQMYSQYGITLDDFETYPFRNGFNKGDIMVLRGPEELAIGDILVFWADGKAEPIIHRIVRVRQLADGSKVYTTKGDHNCGSAGFEQSITSQRMVGKALLRIPYLGWIKIGFVELLRLARLVP